MTSATFQNATERDQDAGWANPRVLLIFGVIFLCGVMFGAVGMRIFLHSRIPRSYAHAMDTARSIQIDQLVGKLRLSEEQKRIVMNQLDEYAKYYQNIEDERSDVAQHGMNAILKCLDVNQRREFEHIVGAY